MTKEEKQKAIEYFKWWKSFNEHNQKAIPKDTIAYKAYQTEIGFYDMAIKALKQEPKTGHWISHREYCENLGVIPSGLGAYEWCSNCDCGIDVREWHRNNYNYCPNCGCRMIEPQESEGKE